MSTYNKYKEDLNEKINKLLGLLITLRTVETSALDSRHWTNEQIDIFSTHRNELMDGNYDCHMCDGSGGVYDGFAQSLSDAQACPECQANGFIVKEVRQSLLDLKSLSESRKSTSVQKHVEEMLSEIYFR